MTLRNPFFSVVVPVHNRADTVLSTLDSVRFQSFEDLECIVVDDGSADGAKLEALIAGLADERFRYVRRENGGGGAARNTGIEEARGKYIAFLDSDDIFLPEKLSRTHDYILRSGANAVYSKAFVDRGVQDRWWVRPDRAIGDGEDMGEYLFVSNQFIPTPTIVMCASSVRSVLFDPMLRKGQDLDFCLRAHAQGIRFQMIDEPLITWVDISEGGRSSRHAGVRAPSEWLRRSSEFLTPAARLGYRATVLAYYQPKWKVGTVVWDLLVGMFIAGVPLKVVARQFLRFALPRAAYRKLANLVVRFKGVISIRS